jgi:hypothetical protein
MGFHSLARMSPLIRALTLVLLALPLAFAVLAATSHGAVRSPALVVAALLGVLYAAVWLFYRPRGFSVSPREVKIEWPLRRRSIARVEIVSARLVSARDVKQELGFCMRIGVGGLWGGFGWLWTSRRGLVDFYVSRTDELVLIERRAGRPLLITPDRAADFVRALA